jgi:mono/diheme cytochrome c family protein
MLSHNRILIGLALLLVLILTLACNPNPQPEGQTPIPTLAPAATLNPSLEATPTSAGGAEASPAPAGGNADNGAAIFAQDCAGCHGQNAQGGGVGPTLVSAEMKAQTDDFFRQTILNGRAGTAMPAWQGRLSAQDIEDVIAFLRSKQ